MKKTLGFLLVFALGISLIFPLISLTYASDPFAYFGYYQATSSGADNNQYFTADAFVLCRFQCGDSGQVTIMSMGLTSYFASHYSMCIYSDDSGSPDELLGYTDFVTWEYDTTDLTWKNGSLVGSPVAVTAGEYYWLGFQYDKGGSAIQYNIRWAGSANQEYYKTSWTSGLPPPDPAGAGFSTANFKIAEIAYVEAIPEEGISLTLDSPANESTVTEFSNSFGYTPYLFGSDSFYNATLYVDGVGVASNSTAITNATLNTIGYSLPENGTYLWDIQLFNSTTGLFSDNGNFTLTASVYEMSGEEAFALAFIFCIIFFSVSLGVAVSYRKR